MKGMRVRDQEILHDRIMSEIKNNGMADTVKIITEKKADTFRQFKKRHTETVRLENKIGDLKKQLHKTREELATDISKFNKQNFSDVVSNVNGYQSNYRCESNAGIQYFPEGDTVYSSDGREEIDAGLYITYEPKNSIQNRIRDELALRTLSTDFDIQKLINDLVQEFSK